jgi:hypothetical protein
MRVLVAMVAVLGSVACDSAMSPTAAIVPTLPEDGGMVTAEAGVSASSFMPAALTPASISGVWTLYTVDGAPLPAVLGREGDIKIELLSDTLTLRADGTSTERAESRFTAGPRVQTDTTVTDGSFKIEGDTIHFAVPHSRRRIATLTRGLLVVPVDGKTWVFRRS